MKTCKINIKNHSVDSSTFSIKKRAFERITKSVYVKLLTGKSEYAGIIMNLSEKGMFISTKGTFLVKPKLKILIPLKEENLKVQGKIQSVGKAGKVYNGIGVELLNPPQNYLNFISNLRTFY
jgi:Tfp pilus assembly protein PilZ